MESDQEQGAWAGTMNMVSSMHKSVLNVCILLHTVLADAYTYVCCNNVCNLTIDRLLYLVAYIIKRNSMFVTL